MGALVVFLREHAFQLMQMAKECNDPITATQLKELSAHVQNQAEYCERKLKQSGWTESSNS
jgi:HAMP domain-containing protein